MLLSIHFEYIAMHFRLRYSDKYNVKEIDKQILLWQKLKLGQLHKGYEYFQLFLSGPEFN